MDYDFSQRTTTLDASMFIHPALHQHFRNDGRAFGTIAEDVLAFSFANLLKKEDNERISSVPIGKRSTQPAWASF